MQISLCGGERRPILRGVSTPPLCILFVDDNPADLLLAREVFEDHRQWVGVVTRQNGLEALNYLKDPQYSHPDVVITDLNMPGLTGFDILKAMKADEELQNIPVVILSTSDAQQDIDMAYSLHASSYMVKSVDFSDFIEQIDAFVKYWLRCRVTSHPLSPA